MSEFDFNENTPVREETSSATLETTTNFQDELRKNMRPKEDVEKEYEELIKKEKERQRREMEAEAMLTLQEIKEKLLQNVKAALYTTKNGVTTVSCLCAAPSRFLSHRPMNNGTELQRNNKSFILLRDPTMHYQKWDEFYITPAYTREYDLYSAALKRLAAEEKISIEFFVSNVSGSGTPKCPFPSDSRNVNISKGALRIQASTVISTEPSAEQAAINAVEQEDGTATEENEQKTTHKKEMSGSAFIGLILVMFVFAVASFGWFSADNVVLGFIFIFIDIIIGFYLFARK